MKLKSLKSTKGLVSYDLFGYHDRLGGHLGFLKMLKRESIYQTDYVYGLCYCLPTPMTLASGGGGGPMFPFVVHQPASPSICSNSGGVSPQIQG